MGYLLTLGRNYLIIRALKIVLGFYIYCQGYPQPLYYKRSTRRTWRTRMRIHVCKNINDATTACYHYLLRSLGPVRRRTDRRTYYSIRVNCHRRSNHLARIVCGLTILSATTHQHQTSQQRGRFDTDSKLVYVDSGATASITNDIADCLTTPVPILRRINAIGGLMNVQVYTTTIGWTFEDDDGVPHLFRIPNSFYIPKAASKLMSPQHWAQTTKDHYPRPRGTKSSVYDTCLVLRWDQRRFTRTIPFNVKGTNIAELYTAPQYRKYQAF
jgi:hypothetical protein